MKNGPALSVDYMLLYQMCRDPKFFSAVPVFAFMQPQATAITQQIVDAVLGIRNCGHCGNDIKQLMAPLMQQFTSVVIQLASTNREALTPLVTYVAGRRGFRPVPLRVYHRDRDGRIAAVEL